MGSMSSIAEILGFLSTEEIQHMLRVGILVDRFTEKLQSSGLMNECIGEYKFFGSAAFYHDIGKAWIPQSILTKPDRLTDPEKRIMRNHPIFAQKLFEQIKLGCISGIPEYLIPTARDSATFHHEWWNGNGYPYGIKQYEIPFVARITSICDAYDAMTGNRVYRKGHSHDYACRELDKCAGIQFDPDLVEIFFNAGIDAAFCSDALLPYL